MAIGSSMQNFPDHWENSHTLERTLFEFKSDQTRFSWHEKQFPTCVPEQHQHLFRSQAKNKELIQMVEVTILGEGVQSKSHYWHSAQQHI